MNDCVRTLKFGDLPLSFIAPQSDHVWLGFLNNWMRMKIEAGFFKELNQKWGIQGQE